MIKEKVKKHDLIEALTNLGLKDKKVAVHSSLSSFGHLAGGAWTVLEALNEITYSSIFPAFFEKAHILPTDYQKYKRNGLFLDLIDRNEWTGDKFYRNSEVDYDMGAIAREAINFKGRERSKHPTRSWIGIGKGLKKLLGDHTYKDLHTPLKNLYKDKDGYILLIGVDLDRCTAIHLAEEIAGRKMFIRWIKRKNEIVDIREAGDSSGFVNFNSYLSSIEKTETVGTAKLRVFKVKELVDACVQLIRKNPEITYCKERCQVCKDMIEGGPYIEK